MNSGLIIIITQALYYNFKSISFTLVINMKYFKFLKKLDQYNQPVFTYIQHRNKKNNEKTNSTNHGTIMGGALSLVCLMTIIVYSVSELSSMMDGKYDNFNRLVKTNPLTPEF